MRLICPGCAAQYEVQASAIPPEGRDVQCSSCGHTWFQRGPLPDGTLPQDRDDAILAAAATTVEQAPEVTETPAPADPQDDVADIPDTDEDDDAADGVFLPPPPQAATVRKVDDAVLSVLREEAEREARARRAETAALETQPDLGLALQPQAAPRRPAERTAFITDAVSGVQPRRAVKPAPAQGDSDTEDDSVIAGTRPAAEGASNPRRSKLPDIDEINSTLRGTSERDGRGGLPTDAQEEALSTRRGFRLGFVAMVGLGVLAVLVYAFAGVISAAVPALAPTLDSYAGAMDGLRLWLGAQAEAAMRAILDWIS
jgi:predicted Zn finger-like uncharacterized protein